MSRSSAVLLVALVCHAAATLAFSAASEPPPATSPQPPRLEQPARGASTVTGKSENATLLVRIKIYGSDGQFQQKSDAMPDAVDLVFVAGLRQPLTAGQIVQAFILKDNREVAPSEPVMVRDIVATSANGEQRLADRPAASSWNSRGIQLRGAPKEGQNVLYGAGSPSDGDNQFSVSAYVNGDLVRLINSQGDETQAIGTSGDGSFSAHLTAALDSGQCIVLVEFPTGQQPATVKWNDLVCNWATSKTRDCAPRTRPDYAASCPVLSEPFFDFGRLRTYFTGGSVLSFDRDNFSHQDLFLAFNVNKNWLWGGPMRATEGAASDSESHPDWTKYRRLMFDTFFEARLTSLPVTACAAPAPITPMKAAQQDSCTAANDNLDTFISSRKAAVLNAGVTMPVIITKWRYRRDPHALSLGPIAKIGFDTPTSSLDQNQAAANSHQFYLNYGFGARMGFHKMSYSPDVAPELLSYFDVVLGRFDSFDAPPGLNAAGQPMQYHRPWRFAFEGMLHVPATPFVLGFSANIHQNFGLHNSRTVDNAKDDLRFFFGAKFDAGRLMSRLGGLN